MSKPFLIICSVLIVVLIGVNIMLEQRNSTPESTATVVNKEGKGEAAIGGAFELTNQNGERVSDANFKGKHSLMFFGFTHCPDVCPTGLTHISTALTELGDKAESITPIFVTIDPERDTPEVMKTYLDNFHPDIVGLTGSVEDIEKTKSTFKVYAKKMEMDWMGEDEYMMDHSAFTYVFDTKGKYITHFAHNTPGTEIAAKLETLL